MNETQCRMARAALNWSIGDLADAAALDRLCVQRFETGDPLLPFKVEALRTAFEKQGVRFVASGQFAGAVMPPQSKPAPHEWRSRPDLRRMKMPESTRTFEGEPRSRGGII